MPDDDKKPGPAFIELTKHTLLVTAAFLVIFAAAIGLDQLASYLVARKVLTAGSPLHWALIIAKYFLLAVDLVVLVVLVVKFGWRAMEGKMAMAHRANIDIAPNELFYESLKEFFLGPLTAIKRAKPAVRESADAPPITETLRLALLLFLYLVEIAIGVLMFLLLWSVSILIQPVTSRLLDSRANSLNATIAFLTLFFLVSFLARSTLKLIKQI